jgi:SAM-dependent methyltransferase
MKFCKYKDHGAYHWNDYKDKNTVYHHHVNFIINWIKDKNVLDVGAGDGLITYLLEAKGIEIDPSAVKLAKEKGADVKRGSAYKLTGHYDAVFMGDTLEHLEFPVKAIRQARKVAPVLYIATPPYEYGKKDTDHYNEWKPDELIDLVEKEGYELMGDIIIQFERMYAKFVYRQGLYKHLKKVL